MPWNYKDTNCEVVVSGKLMRHLYNNRGNDGFSYRSVLARANVFARMKPDDKAMLVASFQTSYLNQKIGMCGDGANDCAALKQADAGISLSQAEASIAAPFTCSVQNIECIPNLLREGKSALATAFQIAKFTITYAMIQYFQIILLYYIGMSMTTNGFLYEDLVALIPFAIFQSLTKAYPKLTKDLPSESLFYLPEFLSIGLQILVMWSIQVALYVTIRSEPWYKPPFNESDSNSIQDQNWVSFEYSVLWVICNFQFVTSVIIFNNGPPFRSPIYTNIPFTICLLVVFAFNWVWIFKADPNRDGWVWNSMFLLDYKRDDPEELSFADWHSKAEIYPTTGESWSTRYRWMLFIVVWVQMIVNYVIELFFIRKLTVKSDAKIAQKAVDDFEGIMQRLSEETNKKVNNIK